MGVDPTLASMLAGADRFAAAARRCLEGLESPTAAESTRTFGDFLRAQMMESLRFPWSANPAAGGGNISMPPVASMPEAPAIGLTREHQLRLQRSAETARRMAEAQHKLQLLVCDALRDASLAFASRLPEWIRPALEPSQAPGTLPSIDTLRRLYDEWIDCAESAYARIAHSESFGGALADFLNASSAWRKETLAGVERWANTLDLPTRSEFNTLLRRVNTLEEQLRSKKSARPARTRRAKRPRS